MGRLATPLVLLTVLVMVVVAGCEPNGVRGASSTTSTTEQPTTTTTAPPPSTTTTEPDPCPGDPFCVVYEIHPDAVWSDGEPVTAADFAHTLDRVAVSSGGGRELTGYDRITRIEALDDKTALVAFSSVFPAWRTLFDVVLPAHHEGALDDPGAPVAGPFSLEEWVPGDRIVLSRNPAYWSDVDRVSGDPIGDVGELVFVFPDSAREQLAGLDDDEIDVVRPRPLDWMVRDLEAMEGVSYALEPGPFWDHIDFNHDDPLLSQAWVREAIALGIDREAILDETVRALLPSASGLDSAIFMQNSLHYEDNYEHVYDPGAAEAILNERFCEKDDDGVYNCQGRRMSFVWATTAGDEYRQTTFDLARDSLREIGIEVILDLRTPSELFSSGVFFGGPDVWQIIDFSWKGEPDPYLANSTFYCDGDAPSGYGSLNVNRYCNPDVASLIRSTERTVDPVERAAAYNEADSIYLGDRAIIPLYQKPNLMAWSAEVAGPEPNASGAGDLWNVGAWSGKSTVVVALESEPDSLDPIDPESDSAEMILSAMFHGAFSANPEFEFLPEIVSGATPFEGGG
jgi:peptide/nickel transport system substrate-binding protein